MIQQMLLKAGAVMRTGDQLVIGEDNTDDNTC